jgi:hypothetical protein
MNPMRWIWIALIALPAVAWAGASMDVSTTIADGPTTIRLSFSTQPQVDYVRESDVYVVRDRRCEDDMFRYGGAWWVVRDDCWYRAASWHGPFTRVRVQAVPVALWGVPERHWKHHPHGMPPGLAKKRGDVVIVDRRDHDRGRGHGHGREGGRDD